MTAFVGFSFRTIHAIVHFMTTIHASVRVVFMLLLRFLLAGYVRAPPPCPLVYSPFPTTAFLTTPTSPLGHYSPQQPHPSSHASAWHTLTTCHYKWPKYSQVANKALATFINADILVVCEHLH